MSGKQSDVATADIDALVANLSPGASLVIESKQEGAAAFLVRGLRLTLTKESLQVEAVDGTDASIVSTYAHRCPECGNRYYAPPGATANVYSDGNGRVRRVVADRVVHECGPTLANTPTVDRMMADCFPDDALDIKIDGHAFYVCQVCSTMVIDWERSDHVAWAITSGTHR